MYFVFSVIVFILIIFSAVIYFRTSRILKSADKMLDSAIDGVFSESNFTEEKLSKIETKMYRYISAGKTAQNKINAERNSIKTLVSDISHQTKTPISNILLYTQLLREAQQTSKKSKELLFQIESQTEKLNFLIQSLIKISRLENGAFSLVPNKHSIKELIYGIDCTAAADKKNIKLIIDDIPDIIAVFDFKWTIEAISNIIDNAIKYTMRGGKVTISAQDYEMFARIDISDTGIGISEDETANIFTRFYRSPSVSDESGVGIGLYLSREIITKEGGYIKVASKVSKGSVFSVFLPKK